MVKETWVSLTSRDTVVPGEPGFASTPEDEAFAERWVTLTDREREMLRMRAEGFTEES